MKCRRNQRTGVPRVLISTLQSSPPPMAISRWLALALGLLVLAAAAAEFRENDLLLVKVNKLTSIKTQLPRSYYSLPFCQPEVIVNGTAKVWDLLHGDRAEDSPYVFEMRKPEKCHIVCKMALSEQESDEIKDKIKDGYSVNMMLDTLPLVVPIKRWYPSDAPVYYQHGFHVGLRGQYAGSKDWMYFLNNHLSFLVKYHKETQRNISRIVAFEVKPYSVKHEWYDNKTRLSTCDPHVTFPLSGDSGPQEVKSNEEIIFTYDVNFEESEIEWKSRWDTYLVTVDDETNRFYIFNSLAIILFLSAIMALIMLRTVYRDISKYNQVETHEEAQEETGWKLVHGDVFRPPSNFQWLCMHIGTGLQIFSTLLIMVIFAVLGFLSPSDRRGLVMTMLLLWAFTGFFGGYSAACLYKLFKGSEWKNIAIRTAFVFPGIAFAVLFTVDTLMQKENSSGAVSFAMKLVLLLLWLGIMAPLVFMGSYLGFKKPAIECPVMTNNLPRLIPKKAWYMNSVFLILVGGGFPFLAVFLEVFLLLTSFWLHQFLTMFRFLFLMPVILTVTCAEISVILCYFQLCKEDYLWWWRSYLTSGSSALYLFLYAIFYFLAKLSVTKTVTCVMYFGYTVVGAYAFFMFTGTIGFCACFLFTRSIYSSVKIN